jgi:hypothetical protein
MKMEAPGSSVNFMHVAPLRAALNSVTTQKTAYSRIFYCNTYSIETNKYSLTEGYPCSLPYTCFGACVTFSFVFVDLIMAFSGAETCCS